jgi:hypothetical protein
MRHHYISELQAANAHSTIKYLYISSCFGLIRADTPAYGLSFAMSDIVLYHQRFHLIAHSRIILG